MDLTRDRISFTFDPKDMLYRSSLALALTELQSLREPPVLSLPLKQFAPRNLKFVTVPSFCPLALISLWMSWALFVIYLAFLST